MTSEDDPDRLDPAAPPHGTAKENSGKAAEGLIIASTSMSTQHVMRTNAPRSPNVQLNMGYSSNSAKMDLKGTPAAAALPVRDEPPVLSETYDAGQIERLPGGFQGFTAKRNALAKPPSPPAFVPSEKAAAAAQNAPAQRTPSQDAPLRAQARTNAPSEEAAASAQTPSFALGGVTREEEAAQPASQDMSLGGAVNEPLTTESETLSFDTRATNTPSLTAPTQSPSQNPPQSDTDLPTAGAAIAEHSMERSAINGAVPLANGIKREPSIMPEQPPFAPTAASQAVQTFNSAHGSPVVELSHISKSFGPVRANDGITLSLMPGERHALLGENGAGKSTLVKILYGMLQPDAGTIILGGIPTRLSSPAEARRKGVGMVFQHFASFDGLSVTENLAAALPDRSRKELKAELKEIESRYGLALEPRRRVGTLSAGEKQRLEIVRCLMQDPQVLILDEPTSVLTPQESETLFQTLERLSDQGIAILYISHRLDDVRRLCQSATILRGGKVVGSCDPRETSTEMLGEMMVGTRTEKLERRPSYVGGALLTVSNLSVPSKTGMALRDVSLSVRRGEILGIAGVAGEGQAELFAALSGETTLRQADRITLADKQIGRMGIRQRRAMGAAFAPEDRHGHAAIPELTLSENLRLTNRRGGLKQSGEIRKGFAVVAEGKDPFAGALSGGNLQKFLIGREIAKNPKILIAAQPTWGVDVAAAAAIHKALQQLRETGAGILVFSQDLDEIFALCDRVAVMHRGQLSEALPVDSVSREDIGVLMGGGKLEHQNMEPRPYV